MIRIDETTSTELVFYSIKDESLDVFAFPFQARSDREAMAMVRNATQPGSALHRFPEQYRLYKVGVFDDRTGWFTSDSPQLICGIADLVSGISDSDPDPDPGDYPGEYPEDLIRVNGGDPDA